MLESGLPELGGWCRPCNPGISPGRRFANMPELSLLFLITFLPSPDAAEGLARGDALLFSGVGTPNAGCGGNTLAGVAGLGGLEERSMGFFWLLAS